MVQKCPADNTQAVDQSAFWGSDGVNWDQHRIGWAIAGACSIVTVIITIISISLQARNYRNRDEQRQIVRIYLMPPVYAVISFFSFRFFRDYTYYSLVEVVYESITLSAFLLLLIQYVASTGVHHDVRAALSRKEKKKMVIPLCCFRYRPTKPAFMHVLKWLVLQYTVIQPAISIAGIITEKYEVYCSQSFSPKYANVYLTAIDFVSISISLFGLLEFYSLTKQELVGRRPLAKFLCIKLIVMFTFYQDFIFSTLQNHGVIKATKYWTASNIADGLDALAICIEMIFFSLAMMWAYPASEYKDSKLPKMSGWQLIKDTLNFSDFIAEIGTSLKFFIDYWRGKPHTRSSTARVNFDEAFGLDGSESSAARFPGHSDDMDREQFNRIHSDQSLAYPSQQRLPMEQVSRNV